MDAPILGVDDTRRCPENRVKYVHVIGLGLISIPRGKLPA
jgi:hypothetical protein